MHSRHFEQPLARPYAPAKTTTLSQRPPPPSARGYGCPLWQDIRLSGDRDFGVDITGRTEAMFWGEERKEAVKEEGGEEM